MSQVEHELLVFPEHHSVPLVVSGVRLALSLVFCVVLKIVVCSFTFLQLAIVLSVLIFTDSDHPLDILSLQTNKTKKCIISLKKLT